MGGAVNNSHRIGDVLLPDEPKRRRRITRRLAIETALATIDEDGLEACSMRSVAERLQVTPRALYRHVTDKDDLLRGVANLILADMRLPAARLPWRQRIRRLAFELRRVLADHPRAAPIFAARATASPPAVVAIVDAVVHAFHDAGLDSERAVRTFFAIFNYTLGFALAAAPALSDEGRSQASVFVGVDPKDVPFAVEVGRFLVHFVHGGLFSSDEQFAYGLDLLLDGLSQSKKPLSSNVIAIRREQARGRG